MIRAHLTGSWKLVLQNLLLIIPLAISSLGVEANCSSNHIALASQAEVDSFQANHGPDCNHIGGNLELSGKDIANLDGLAGLGGIGGYLWIHDNDILTDLSGLMSLTSVGDGLYLRDNDELSSIHGLDNVVTVSRAIWVAGNRKLKSLSQLSGIHGPIVDLMIFRNNALENLDGLSGITRVFRTLEVNQHLNLLDIDGLANVKSVGLDLHFWQNGRLPNLHGLGQLEHAGTLLISGNTGLVDLRGLENLVSLGNKLEISYNQNLTSLDALSSLVSVANSVELVNNPSLSRCEGLIQLLDGADDSVAGPGPNSSGIPDIGGEFLLEGNATSCNSLESIFAPVPATTRTTFFVDISHSDGNPKTGTVDLACIGIEDVTPISIVLSDSQSAEFEVLWSGVPGTARCTAKLVSSNRGYAADASACTDFLLGGGDSERCEILNVQERVSFTVMPRFTDYSVLRVESALSCDDGVVEVEDALAGMYQPAQYWLSELPYAGTDCSADLVLPEGYRFGTYGWSCFGNGHVLPGNEDYGCDIYVAPKAELEKVLLEVEVNFSDGNPELQRIDLRCNNGSQEAMYLSWAGENQPDTVNVYRYSELQDSKCSGSAHSEVNGYSVDLDKCLDVSLTQDSPVCSIHFQQRPATVSIHSDFLDGNNGSVELGLTCSSGTVEVQDSTASAADPAEFIVRDFLPSDTTCTPVATFPDGYQPYESTCQNLEIFPGTASSCLITNRPTSGEWVDATAVTGSWYDPASSGEGLMIHAVDEDTAVAYFYGYDAEGDRFWLIGQSEGVFTMGEPLEFNATYAIGGSFSAFNKAFVARRSWGVFEFTQWDCDSATVRLHGFTGNKTLELTRLAATAGTRCSGEDTASEMDAVTGSWFEPETSGQGFSVHKVAEDRGVIYFYGFDDDGENRWMIGVWDQEWKWSETFVIPMQQALGGTFGKVVPEEIVREDWGTLTIRFDSCSTGWAKLEGLDGVQELDLTLLAGSMGLECNPVRNWK